MTMLTKAQIDSMDKEELTDKYLEMQYRLALLEERMAISQSNKFGQKTERFVDGEQQQFNELDDLAIQNPNEPEPKIEQVVESYTRKKTVGKREEDLKDLPVRIINHELTDEELVMHFGESGYKRLPDEVYKKLNYIPAVYEVQEHHIAVYASKTDDVIVKANHPAELLNNSIATPSIVASIMNVKYTNALPLYRLEQEYQRRGIFISRQTMANWVIKCTERYLSLVYERLHKLLTKRKVIQADETTVLVSKDGRAAGSKSYMWLYRTNELDDAESIVLFDYEKTRSSEHPKEFLKDFSGILECDGYSGYHKLGNDCPNITIANCWAHARRSFSDAIKAAKVPQGSPFNTGVATEALRKIQKIYDEDSNLKKFVSSERKKRRQKNIKPLVEDFFAWVKTQIEIVPPKSATGEGLKYCINQEPYLKVFLDNGDVPIDNSASERAIRPFTIARKNFVMIDSVAGAQSSAMIYSIVETAKANNIKPYEYMKHLLTVIPQHMDDTNLDFIDDLLPWSSKLPEDCIKITK